MHFSFFIFFRLTKEFLQLDQVQCNCLPSNNSIFYLFPNLQELKFAFLHLLFFSPKPFLNPTNYYGCHLSPTTSIDLCIK